MPERNFRSRGSDELGLDQISHDLDSILQDSMRNLQSLRGGRDTVPVSSFIPRESREDDLFGSGSFIAALDDLVDTPAAPARLTIEMPRREMKPATKQKKKKSTANKTWRPAGAPQVTPPPSASQPLPPGSARRRKPAIPSTRPATPTANDQAKKMQLRITGLQNALKNSSVKIVSLEDQLADTRSKLTTALRKLDTLQLVNAAAPQPRTDTGAVLSKLREELAVARKERDSSNEQLNSVKTTLVRVLHRARQRTKCPNCHHELPPLIKKP
eukprot:gene679-416_t